jgi:NDP-sugar pyrophosphorylase family protein
VKFFILAGGYGKRAEPLSLVKPKPAFPLGGVPLLARQLRQLRALGCRRGFINLHHLGGQVVAAAGSGSGIHFIEETDLSGSRVLRQALPFFSEWLLVMNGDTYLDIPLADLLRETRDPRVDGVLLARRDDSGRYAGLRLGGDGFLEGTTPAAGAARGGLMYAGAGLFRKKAVEKIDEINFFASIRRRRLRFKTVPYDGIWLDIGTPASYFQANWEFMARRRLLRANALSADVAISRRARVERSVLWENTRVGPGVRVTECIVTGDLELWEACYSRQIVTRLGVSPLF